MNKMPRSALMFAIAAVFGLASTKYKITELPLLIQLFWLAGLLIFFVLGCVFMWKSRNQ